MDLKQWSRSFWAGKLDSQQSGLRQRVSFEFDVFEKGVRDSVEDSTCDYSWT